MSEMVIHITKEELQQLIEASVEQALLELFGDPDNGLELREAIKERLRAQREAVSQGKRGKDLDDVIRDLALD